MNFMREAHTPLCFHFYSFILNGFFAFLFNVTRVANSHAMHSVAHWWCVWCAVRRVHVPSRRQSSVYVSCHNLTTNPFGQSPNAMQSLLSLYIWGNVVYMERPEHAVYRSVKTQNHSQIRGSRAAAVVVVVIANVVAVCCVWGCTRMKRYATELCSSHASVCAVRHVKHESSDSGTREKTRYCRLWMRWLFGSSKWTNRTIRYAFCFFADERKMEREKESGGGNGKYHRFSVGCSSFMCEFRDNLFSLRPNDKYYDLKQMINLRLMRDENGPLSPRLSGV